LLGNPTT